MYLFTFVKHGVIYILSWTLENGSVVFNFHYSHTSDDMVGKQSQWYLSFVYATHVSFLVRRTLISESRHCHFSFIC